MSIADNAADRRSVVERVFRILSGVGKIAIVLSAGMACASAGPTGDPTAHPWAFIVGALLAFFFLAFCGWSWRIIKGWFN